MTKTEAQKICKLISANFAMIRPDLMTVWIEELRRDHYTVMGAKAALNLLLKQFPGGIDPDTNQSCRITVGRFYAAYLKGCGKSDIQSHGNPDDFKGCSKCHTGGWRIIVMVPNAKGGFSPINPHKPIPATRPGVFGDMLIPCDCEKGRAILARCDHLQFSPAYHQQLLKGSFSNATESLAFTHILNMLPLEGS